MRAAETRIIRTAPNTNSTGNRDSPVEPENRRPALMIQALPADALAALSKSTHFDWRLAPYDIAGSKAHVAMLAKQGIVEGEDAQAITEGLNRIAAEYEANGVPVNRLRLELETTMPEDSTVAATTPVMTGVRAHCLRASRKSRSIAPACLAGA